MAKKDYDIRTIVLRKNLTETDAMEIVNQKKTSPFKSLLTRPKKEQVHVHSLKLYHESILMVSAKYVADYYRKATHTISVDYNIKDVVLGGGLFPIRSKSGFSKALSGKRGKNKIDLKLEEHVFVEEEDTLYFDHHGRDIKFPFKINSKTIENYPKKILEKNAQNVKKPELTYDAAVSKIQTLLKKPLDTDVRDLSDEFILGDVAEIYIPIFEARLIGPKKKVELLRIDAVRKKIL